jgi:hypothetical protein
VHEAAAAGWARAPTPALLQLPSAVNCAANNSASRSKNLTLRVSLRWMWGAGSGPSACSAGAAAVSFPCGKQGRTSVWAFAQRSSQSYLANDVCASNNW